MSAKVLLGDLSNGLYLKLALAETGRRPDAPTFYACASLADLENAIVDFLSENGQPDLVAAGLSTSGWEIDGEIDLVHYGFALDRGTLRNLLGVQRIAVVNDFVAKALAVPMLEGGDREKVCGGDISPAHVIAVIGPTAGLGGAFLSPDNHGGWVATHCEGGHSDFAARTPLEMDILRLLMERYGHVSWERGVSAPGLIELWRCLAIIEGDTGDVSAPGLEEILALAHIGDPRARRAVTVQTELFASVASDFALTMGAKGGVYLSGSHLEMLGGLFDYEIFAKRFYDKGRVSSYVHNIPVYRITAAEPEILGLSTLFD